MNGMDTAVVSRTGRNSVCTRRMRRAQVKTAGGSGYDIRSGKKIVDAVVTICTHSFVAMEAQRNTRSGASPAH